MDIFNYKFLSARKNLLFDEEDRSAEQWAVDWANVMGEKGWEFVNFEIQCDTIYGDQPNMDEPAPAIGTRATASGFAKRRVSPPPYR